MNKLMSFMDSSSSESKQKYSSITWESFDWSEAVRFERNRSFNVDAVFAAIFAFISVSKVTHDVMNLSLCITVHIPLLILRWNPFMKKRFQVSDLRRLYLDNRALTKLQIAR